MADREFQGTFKSPGGSAVTGTHAAAGHLSGGEAPRGAPEGLTKFVLETMDSASKYMGLLALPSLSRCVSASASVTQQLLSARPPRPRPFRVTNAERSLKKGLTAHALDDLLLKVTESLNVSTETVLVLEEDGTEIDSEDFFQTVPENSVLMVLDRGQRWTPLLSGSSARLRDCDQDRTDVAKITLDLYKNSPKDFIGCLNVKATLYGAYSVSYDVRCYAAKRLLKEALRWTVFSMQATGHVLLGSSCYIERLLREEDEGKLSLMLPPDSVVKNLQAMLLPRAFLLRGLRGAPSAEGGPFC